MNRELIFKRIEGVTDDDSFVDLALELSTVQKTTLFDILFNYANVFKEG